MFKRVQASKEVKEANKDVGNYVNKQRTLIFSTRGIVHRDRHLMTDLRDLLPHSRKDTKFDAKDQLEEVNEIADMKNCNNCLFFEARKHQDLYLWAARAPQGPSIKFLVQNIHTMSEVKLTGNCLKGSRPVMHFDKSFADAPQSVLMRELLSQCFGSPKGHPKVKPFVDHIFSFFFINGRIWFRNYQIAYDANRGTEKEGEPVLVEIGPRFVLTPVKIFAGSFRGAVLWENKDYISPNVKRAMLKRRHQATREVRADAKRARSAHVEANPLHTDELEDVFL